MAPDAATRESEDVQWNAVVLAGGRASRLGGVDKTALRVDGRTLLELALEACADAGQVAVVGGARSGAAPSPGVRTRLRHTHAHPDAAALRAPVDAHALEVHERVPFGGPAAAVAAGLAALAPAAWTALLAADLPAVGRALPVLLDRIRCTDADVVVAVDDAGRDQHLLALHRTAPLQRAVEGAGGEAGLRDAPLRRLMAELTVERVPLGAACADVDTPADATRLGVALPDRQAVRRAG